jgi:hypothetical protein
MNLKALASQVLDSEALSAVTPGAPEERLACYAKADAEFTIRCWQMYTETKDRGERDRRGRIATVAMFAVLFGVIFAEIILR